VKPKSNRKNVPSIDQCWTPPDIVSLIAPYVHRLGMDVIDPGAGTGALAAALWAHRITAQGYELSNGVPSDHEDALGLAARLTLPGFPKERRRRTAMQWMADVEGMRKYFSEIAMAYSGIIFEQDYFKLKWPSGVAQVTNPPYSIKPEWLAQALANGEPFALLMPGEFMFTKGYIELVKNLYHPIELVIPDTRVNFGMPDLSWTGSENRDLMQEYWIHQRLQSVREDPSIAAKKGKNLRKWLKSTPSAQFPVAWYTWKMNIGSAVTYAHYPRRPFYMLGF